MPWLKIDDGEGMAPWVMRAGNEAYGAYVRMGSYAAQQLTDGRVPAAIAAMIVGDVNGDGQSPILVRLTIAGQVHVHETGDVELLHFLDANPSAAQVEADRESRKSRAEKAAAARWSTKR